MTWQHYLRFHPIFTSKKSKHSNSKTSSSFHSELFNSSSTSPLFTPASFKLDSISEKKTNTTSLSSKYDSIKSKSNIHDHYHHHPLYSAPKSRNTLAMHENTLAIIIDQELRLLDLRIFKRVVDKSISKLKSENLSNFFKQVCPYRIVQVPNIHLDFNVIQLEFDPFGRFLAVLGLRRLVVIDIESKLIPKLDSNAQVPGFSSKKSSFHSSNSSAKPMTSTSSTSSLHSKKKSKKISFCVGYELGQMDLSLGQTHLLQCAWSPHAMDLGCLFVLSEDSFFRVYDLSVSMEYPFAMYSFFNPHLHMEYKNPLSPQADACRIAGFCLGATLPYPSEHVSTPYHVWHTFTVYGVMRNGDIYALCPVMPSKCMVDTSTWLAMKASIDYFTEDSVSQTTLLQFLNGIESIHVLDKETISFQPPVMDAYTLSPQPLVCEGATSMALDALHVYASDILCLSPQLLLVSYLNGYVDVLVFDQVLPEWGPCIFNPSSPFSFCASLALQTIPCFFVQTLDLETSGDLRFLHSLTTLPSESVPSSPLSSNVNASKSTLSSNVLDSSDVSDTYLVHCFHALGVHQVYLRLNPPHFALFNVIQTVPLVNTTTMVNPVVGCQCILDSLLNPTLLARTLDDVFAVPLYPFDFETQLKRQLLPSLSLSSPSSSSSDSNPDAAPSKLSLPSTLPKLQPDTWVVPSFISLRCSSSSTSMEWTPELLTYLQKVYQQVSMYLHHLNQISLDLREHILAQRHLIQAAEATLSHMPSSYTVQLPSLQPYQHVHDSILKKLDIMLQYVYDVVHSDQLTEQEEQYFECIQETAQELQSLKQRCQKLLRYRPYWASELEKRRTHSIKLNSPKSVPEFSEAQEVRLQRILYQQYKEIDNLQKSVLALQL